MYPGQGPPGYPPQEGPPGYGGPPMGQPPMGYPPQGPPQGYPPQGPPQGYPPQGPPQGYPPQGPPQGYPPQGPPQGYPPQQQGFDNKGGPQGGNGTLYVGARVQTQYTRQEGGDDGWYQGVIQALHPNGMAQILYDDGDNEQSPFGTVFLVQGQGGMGPPPGGPSGAVAWAGPPPGPYPGQGMPNQGPPQQMMGGGPANLGNLAQVPAVWIRQKVDFAEIMADVIGGAIDGLMGDMISNIEISNTYNIYQNQGDMENGQNRWLFAKEKSDGCSRYLCGHKREFDLVVGTPIQQRADTIEERLGLISSDEVIPFMKVHRPCYCCLSDMQIDDGMTGQNLGHFEEGCTNLMGCCPLDASITTPGGPGYKMSGTSPCWIQCCVSCPCRDAFEFEIKKEDSGEPIGVVRNHPNGFCKACFTEADDYEVEFAPNSTWAERGLTLATAFALDYAYFECKNQDSNQNIGGMF